MKLLIKVILLVVSVSILDTCQPIYADLSQCPPLLKKITQVLSVHRMSYYTQAETFAKTHGYEFAKLVESKIPTEGRTGIVVVMGGAEHLGNLLREYIRLRSISNVDVKEVWLNRAITGAWQYEAKWSTNQRSSDGSPIFSYSHLVGALDKPRPNLSGTMAYEAYNVYDYAGNNSSQELLEYANQLGLWTYDHLIVVDTGFKGTMPDVVGLLAAKAHFSGSIQGVLYAFEGTTVNLTIPVIGYVSSTQAREAAMWAYLLDTGFDHDSVNSRYFGFARPTQNVFQRSLPKVSRLVFEDEKAWVPNEKLYEDAQKRENYQQTLDGLSSGLRQRMSILNRAFRLLLNDG